MIHCQPSAMSILEPGPWAGLSAANIRAISGHKNSLARRETVNLLRHNLGDYKKAESALARLVAMTAPSIVGTWGMGGDWVVRALLLSSCRPSSHNNHAFAHHSYIIPVKILHLSPTLSWCPALAVSASESEKEEEIRCWTVTARRPGLWPIFAWSVSFR